MNKQISKETWGAAENILKTAIAQSEAQHVRQSLTEGDTWQALRVICHCEGTPLWDGLSSIAKSVLCYLATGKSQDTMGTIIYRLRKTADNLEANNKGDEQNG